MKFKKIICFLIFTAVCGSSSAQTDHSVARLWNEIVLQGIRGDESRPTVHARNLFQISAAMYDAWAVFDPEASCYFLGQTHRGFHIPYPIDFKINQNELENEREKAISHAAFGLIKHRFEESIGWRIVRAKSLELMAELGFDPEFVSTDYTIDGAGALGNYIAEQIIQFGFVDGSNELNNYTPRHYSPSNGPVINNQPGTNNIVDPNKWQPIQFADISFLGQGVGPVFQPGGIPDFVTPEWGQVYSFAIEDKDLTTYMVEGEEYMVYHDPGPPSLFDSLDIRNNEGYKWGFELTAKWSSHHNPNDGIIWDISPNSIGNIQMDDFPKTLEEYKNFYLKDGGDVGSGYLLNPITNNPYTPQMVPRGDYSRVLAEFWADGPESETPPGHWFVILNYVNDHPQNPKLYKGTEAMSNLEWDIKSYFSLGGAVHDAAISAWGIKGYYDYVRPMSAIRFLTELGQSSQEDLFNFNPFGITLDDDLIRVSDTVIQIRSWNGRNRGVSWVDGRNWRPYQRANFLTPPFAGYVSGHSTFSRAAARLLTEFTGSEFFPGGLGEFEAPALEFLKFDIGPSVPLTLQWAKYYDASDQCSLSRIWGGIHPPIDDIPGRRIGDTVGKNAFDLAEKYFMGLVDSESPAEVPKRFRIYPNPSNGESQVILETIIFDELPKQISIFNSNGKRIQFVKDAYFKNKQFPVQLLLPGTYFVVIESSEFSESHKVVIK